METKRRTVVDVYAVLGADRNSTWIELRTSYRRRARELHPDVQAHRPAERRLDPSRATALFSRLQAAWALVATPERRAAYDEAVEGRSISRTRPAVPPGWRAPLRAGVLLRTGPGDLHIASPGLSWDLSLKQFLERCSSREQALVIGDLPPHPESRRALREVRYVERHRLATMVGVVDAAEERGEVDLDDEGAWKLGQVGRALDRWGAAFPGRAGELPYRHDLELMGRLSLAGYELNLPHPAGLFAAVEPRARERAEAKRRGSLPQLELSLPPAVLLLAAYWAGDRPAMESLAAWGRGESQRLEPLLRTLEGRRPRADGYELAPGAALDRGLPGGLAAGWLAEFPRTEAWVGTTPRRLRELPWGEPTSLCGEDRSLSDSGARLMALWLGWLLGADLAGAELVSFRGARLRWRAPDPQATGARVTELVRRFSREVLGTPVEPRLQRIG